MKTEDFFTKYSESVSFAADNSLNNVLYNEGDEHAIFIFSNMFRTAKKEILLYARNIFSLENKVTTSASYITELLHFLKRENTSLRIILSEYNPDTDTNLLRESIAEYRSKIQIKTNIKQNIKISDNLIHFCIADGKMYRMEYDIKHRKARCNFNDIVSCKKFTSLFNQMFISESAIETFI